MRAGVARWVAIWVLVAAGCHGSATAPSCTIGQPCEISNGQGTTYEGNPCIGEQATDNGQPFCSCTCGPGLGVDAGAEAGDAGSTSEAGSEAGACGSGPASACNQLANVGTVVTPTCVAGSAPAMTGGAIADGTYVLFSGTAYASTCTGVSLPPGGPTTIRVTSGCTQSIDVAGGAKTDEWTTSGSTLTTVEVCPGSGSQSFQYTATADSLTEVAPLGPGIEIVAVFKKQ